MDMKEERTKLKARCEITSSKITRWTADIQNLLMHFQNQRGEIVKYCKDIEEDARCLQELKEQSNVVNSQLQEKELLSEKLQFCCQSIEREQEVLQSQDKKIDEKLKELSKGVRLFEERLGLSFRKTSGKKLQVVFTNIDHKDPESPFYFFLQIENGRYIVSGCEPTVKDLDLLVEKLNTTNNLHSFVIALRKRFRKLVEK